MKRFWLWLISPGVMAAIALIGVGLAVYTGFYFERRPEISISVDALSKVFDLHRPIGGLEVSYAGQDLRSSKKTLWVLTVTIRNDGNSEVRKGDYDEQAPLGFFVQGAVIAERPTVKTSVDYIGKNLSVSSPPASE